MLKGNAALRRGGASHDALGMGKSHKPSNKAKAHLPSFVTYSSSFMASEGKTCALSIPVLQRESGQQLCCALLVWLKACATGPQTTQNTRKHLLKFQQLFFNCLLVVVGIGSYSRPRSA
jgi:hypothetical protein